MCSWAILVHVEDAKAITTAFWQVLITANARHTQRLQTDNEFINFDLQTLMKSQGVQHFAS